ncbi:MAG TPA: hypothetical protein VFH73_21895, partial [Polyangia bacterium]|nr:hypothetical protein [Polyangia bacterium]
LASATVQVGVHWDIAWHRSIGRDTFWSPPHMAIYLAAVLAALASGTQILATTFAGPGQRRARAVSVLGFRGPLGAFITAWGGIAMLTSAPFDDWWHNAYGLDVKILSPPHIVLAIGIFAINVGALIFVLGRPSGDDAQSRRRLAGLSFYAGGIIIVALLTLFMERTVRVFMHGAAFYAIVAAVVPAILAAISRTTGHRRAATITAAVYSLFLLALLWLMPLVPAEPKLGPVLVRVTHLIPPEFPLLLIFPAFALDLLWTRTAEWTRTRQAVATGAVFAAVFLVVQWPFANFLMSPGARNYFFGAKYFNYNTPLDAAYIQHRFLPHATTLAAFIGGAAKVLAMATASSWIGLAWGDWMRRLRR